MGRLSAAAAALVAASLSAVAVAQPTPKFERDCREWIERKGYSSDYIEQRVGERQAGRARQWQPNVELAELAPGDVVLQGVEAPDGHAQRVAVVESVVRNADGSIRAVRVSEMNMGKLVDAHCHVTENFGKVTTRTIAIDRVRSAWRPDR